MADITCFSMHATKRSFEQDELALASRKVDKSGKPFVIALAWSNPRLWRQKAC